MRGEEGKGSEKEGGRIVRGGGGKVGVNYIGLHFYYQYCIQTVN